MMTLGRRCPGKRNSQRDHSWAASRRTYRTIGILALLLLPLSSGCAWWREYRDTFAYSQGLYRKAMEIEAKGKPDEAVIVLRQSIEANPDDPEVRWELARILLEQGQTKDALQELRYLVKHYPDDSRAYMTLARTLLQRGRFDDAAQLADLALDLDSNSTEGLVLRAQIAEAQHQVDRALETYHYILLQQPENPDVRICLARLKTEQGDSKAAAALLRETLANVPLTEAQAGQAQWLLGLNYADQERWADAATALAIGLPFQNASAREHYELAYACYRAGDTQRARAELTQVLHTEPANQSAQAMLQEIEAVSDIVSLPPLNIIPVEHSQVRP